MHHIMEFTLRHAKTTKFKACYKENMNRIGKIYLSFHLIDRLGIGDEILVQIAPDKSFFPPEGYVAQFAFNKKTPNTTRYAEKLTEPGELGTIYISEEVMKEMSVGEEIAVRIVPSGSTGGVSVGS